MAGRGGGDALIPKGPSKMMRFTLLTLLAQVSVAAAFAPPGADRIRLRGNAAAIGRRAAADGDAGSGDSAADAEEDGSGGPFAALPPIGASTFWDRAADNTDATASGSAHARQGKNIIISEHANLVSRKFQLQYTCKVCGIRNSHSISRIAYRKGVVIAQCKGCEFKHLIADNLGWSNYIGGFDFDGGERDIEAYMKNRDREARESGEGEDATQDLVMRVNQDVFDLETMLYNQGNEDEASPTRGTDGDGQVAEDSSWN